MGYIVCDNYQEDIRSRNTSADLRAHLRKSSEDAGSAELEHPALSGVWLHTFDSNKVMCEMPYLSTCNDTALSCPWNCPYQAWHQEFRCYRQCFRDPSSCDDWNPFYDKQCTRCSNVACLSCPDGECAACLPGYELVHGTCTPTGYIPLHVLIVTLCTLAAIVVCIGVCLYVLHRFHARKSKEYRRLVAASEHHRVQCRARIPKFRGAACRQREVAETLNIQTFRDIIFMKVHDFYITGIGLPMYTDALTLFFWLTMFGFFAGTPGIFYDELRKMMGLTHCAHISGKMGLMIEMAEELPKQRMELTLKLLLITVGITLYRARKRRHLTKSFDMAHTEMEDYAMEAFGFPEDATDEAEITKYVQTAVNGAVHVGPTPVEVVGTSIGYDFHEHAAWVEKEIEEHIIAECSRSTTYGGFFEAREAWLPDQSSSSEEEEGLTSSEYYDPPSCSKASDDEDGRAGSGDDEERQEARERLQAMRNSGTVVLVFRYACNTEETLQLVAGTLRDKPFREKHKIQVRLLSTSPPSVNWANFRTRLFDGMFSKRIRARIAANLCVLGGFTVLLLLYWVMYRLFYADMKGKGQLMDGLKVKTVTLFSALGNALMNQVVWASSQRLGFRFKSHADVYVCVWNTVIVLTNVVFSVYVVILLQGDMPTNTLAKIVHDMNIGTSIIVVVRGSLIVYAISPLINIYWWFQGRAYILLSHILCPTRDWPRARRAAEVGTEPPEWWMQYDFAAIVVVHTSSCICLSFYGDQAWRVFTWDLFWACATRCINMYTYLALSRETFFTSGRLDGAVFKLQLLPIGTLAAISIQWALRCEGGVDVQMVSFVAVSLVLVYAVGIHFLLDIPNKSEKDRVWYERVPYEEVERMFPYNWWNTNPIHILRGYYGMAGADISPHRRIFYKHGLVDLQPN
eukprot:TRINITY_DN2305_c2_g1_i1.p1 TRINITY_DN2305_c2_g1~~TRINITY_DN2305_c2_g1_i1.p1  ORF type:complete len:935 (-),score=139.64 TRINITY_DN2305_c2_g1_i1:12-2744(-)